MDQLERKDDFGVLRSRVRTLLKRTASDALTLAPDASRPIESAEKVPPVASTDALGSGESPDVKEVVLKEPVSADYVLNSMLDYVGNKVPTRNIQIGDGPDEMMTLRYALNPSEGFTQGWPAHFEFKPGDPITIRGKTTEGKMLTEVQIPLPANGELFLRILEAYLGTGKLPDPDIISGNRPMLADSVGLLTDSFVVTLRGELQDQKNQTVSGLAALYEGLPRRVLESMQLEKGKETPEYYMRYETARRMVEEKAESLVRAGYDVAATTDELYTWRDSYTSASALAVEAMGFSRDVADGEDTQFVFWDGARADALNTYFEEKLEGMTEHSDAPIIEL